MLSDLIEYDQTGVLKGRSIAENICLINNVISYTHSKGIPGLLLFVDFEKAFILSNGLMFEKPGLEHFGLVHLLLIESVYFIPISKAV